MNARLERTVASTDIVHMPLLSKLVGFLVALATIGMIFLAGWLLNLAGKDRGRWQPFTMFLPALILLCWAVFLKRKGGRTVGTFIVSGLFFAFGVAVLLMG
jgi:hypothetical protein